MITKFPKPTNKQFKDITGQRFGKYRVMDYAGYTLKACGIKQHYWICQCDCGNTKEVEGGNLRRGRIVSCGCHIQAVKTTHNKSNSRAYTIWCSMLTRCSNPNHKNYRHYGGRGITVCESWQNSFEAFYNDMGDPPENLTLDRIDNEKGYSKDNCRWATWEEQNNNQRPRSSIRKWKDAI
jgi:hypothetical protein